MPDNFIELALMVVLLGIKHGIDPDHLVAIDGLTRFNASDRPRLSRWIGFLFSLGHGLVVIAFTLFIGAATTRHSVPHWTETLGALTSITFLLALGALNLHAALRADADHAYRPIGLRSTFLNRFFQARCPLSIILVGMLFAVSFDTLSQVALFAATTTLRGGWQYPVVLSLFFTIGMMLPDAVNGLWLSRLIGRTSRQAPRLSRIMGGVIAFLSLMIGGINFIQFVQPSTAAWIDFWQPLISIAIILVVMIGFQLALATKPRQQPDVSPENLP